MDTVYIPTCQHISATRGVSRVNIHMAQYVHTGRCTCHHLSPSIPIQHVFHRQCCVLPFVANCSCPLLSILIPCPMPPLILCPMVVHPLSLHVSTHTMSLHKMDDVFLALSLSSFVIPLTPRDNEMVLPDTSNSTVAFVGQSIHCISS